MAREACFRNRGLGRFLQFEWGFLSLLVSKDPSMRRVVTERSGVSDIAVRPQLYRKSL
jgi:hypothetical protein